MQRQRLALASPAELPLYFLFQGDRLARDRFQLRGQAIMPWCAGSLYSFCLVVIMLTPSAIIRRLVAGLGIFTPLEVMYRGRPFG